MAYETERKFLVRGNFRPHVTHSFVLKQGYLQLEPERTVRVRIKGDKAYLTIKGATSPSGLTRHEWEYGIPLTDAQEMLRLCADNVIEKTRHLIPCGSLMFEVDEFGGENEGLVVAEIELPNEDTPFDHPDWLGDEVTGDVRYYNSALSKNPYKRW